MAGPNANLPDGEELAVLPFSNDVPWYSFVVTLATVQYTFSMTYNTRMSRWILDIGDASGNLLLAGLPVLIDRNMNGQYFYLEIPQGTLFCVDDTNTDTEPTRLSFGLSNTGWYLDPSATT